jgi:hypothetical protein
MKTIPQLAIEVKDALQASHDLSEAQERNRTEALILNKKMADLVNGKVEGTLAELQGFFDHAKSLTEMRGLLNTKVYQARDAACDAYQAALEILAKEAGLPEGFTVRARFTAPRKNEDKQMVGQMPVPIIPEGEDVEVDTQTRP